MAEQMEQPELVYIVQPLETQDDRVMHEEAIALIQSAGADYAGTIYQTIREVNPATYIGEGKLQELSECLNGLDATVLFNGTLSPSQTLNISEALGGRKVIDRTTLILDIFALRAVTREGKLQVELAQLKYLYPRLKGKGEALSRLGGGIGTRGPGESKLETDRRHIRTRIHSLEEKLKELEQRRSLLSERRKKQRIYTIALVGYTNTGKSSLMNALTNADVLTRNAYFATLDPTSRLFEVDGIPFLLIDTVGFLRGLPHQLIEAFHSTLEVAVSCDLALVVCDATEDYTMQYNTTMQTLQELKFSSQTLTVMNKCDLVEDRTLFPKDACAVSAKTGQGMESLKCRILEFFRSELVKAVLFVAYADTAEYSSLRAYVYEQNTTCTETGMEISAMIPKIYFNLLRKFIKS